MNIRYFIAENSEKLDSTIHIEVDGKINPLCRLFTKAFLCERPEGYAICKRCIRHFNLPELEDKPALVDTSTLSITYITSKTGTAYHVDIDDQPAPQCAINTLYCWGDVTKHGITSTEKPKRPLCRRCQSFYAALGINL